MRRLRSTSTCWGWLPAPAENRSIARQRHRSYPRGIRTADRVERASPICSGTGCQRVRLGLPGPRSRFRRASLLGVLGPLARPRGIGVMLSDLSLLLIASPASIERSVDACNCLVLPREGRPTERSFLPRFRHLLRSVRARKRLIVALPTARFLVLVNSVWQFFHSNCRRVAQDLTRHAPWCVKANSGCDDRDVSHKVTPRGIRTAAHQSGCGGFRRLRAPRRVRAADIVVAARSFRALCGDVGCLKPDADRIEGVRPCQSVEERIIIRKVMRILRSTTYMRQQ